MIGKVFAIIGLLAMTIIFLYIIADLLSKFWPHTITLPIIYICIWLLIAYILYKIAMRIGPTTP